MKRKSSFVLAITAFLSLLFYVHSEAGPVGNIRGVPKLEKQSQAFSGAILSGAGNVYLMLRALEEQKPATEFHKNAQASLSVAVNQCEDVLRIIESDMKGENITSGRFLRGLARLDREIPGYTKAGVISESELQLLREFKKDQTPLESYRPICTKSKILDSQLARFELKASRLLDQWKLLTTLEDILTRAKVISKIFESAN